MKKIISFAAVVALGISALPALSDDVPVSIGSNPVGNTAYQWAAGISDLVNRKVEGVQMTAEGTKGYVANVRLMLNNDIEAGFSNSKLAYEAYKAEGDYADVEPGRILSWMSIAPIVQHVVVLESSDIKSLNDLKGKRVGMGQPGGTSMLDAEILLETIGLNPGEDFKDFRVKLPAMVDMLKDGQIDAFMWNGSIPLPPIIKLKASHNIRFLSIPTEVSDAIRAKYAAYSEGDLPANTYPDQTNSISSYRLGNVLLIRADVPEEIVYQATKTVMENLDHMATVHPAWKRVSTDSILGGFNAPLHPGALRYYREANVPGIEEFAARTSN
ncbi:TAXI family TRAP transporter solute-binding subunit [Amylibacter sp.]|nr:TAXI family TRAP transporter solute-binding subunit [Amylibacter sp.]MDB2600557.1 TAXI family TRAP transporter solute-binding subunit [Amylibacter sp.]